jgi:hypothetical protein
MPPREQPLRRYLENYERVRDDNPQRPGNQRRNGMLIQTNEPIFQHDPRIHLNNNQAMQLMKDVDKNAHGYVIVRPAQPNDQQQEVPQMKTGGFVKKTQIVKVHKGEVVIPAHRVASVEKAVKKAGLKSIKSPSKK